MSQMTQIFMSHADFAVFSFPQISQITQISLLSRRLRSSFFKNLGIKDFL